MGTSPIPHHAKDFGQYDLFMECLSSIFETEQGRYLMSHFLWDAPRTEMLLRHMRLMDAVRRVYFVSCGVHAPPHVIISSVRQLVEHGDPRLVEDLMGGCFPRHICDK
ncbi:Hypothetical Protein FCC1311_048252 [Hondaea fermentalgiana]|uniref:Uncharacterized protein n=1 Tax=Hondaea fermentalgiana TaxID=2315210 RepID=A0A2R5GL51_9STRA|nr:Hypothetical Protein FCC1311_048252 [Hondaea fermentalgiana]|eukprot:GBG28604.1 Hypothetical Protein FCC1311_048252 [Hondaea fermentalgiana]